jgi:hypothetical protein
MNRSTLKPQGSEPSPVGYRRLRNGIASSADHPSRVRRAATRHTARQSALNEGLSSVIKASYSAPFGFVAKTNAFRWSWNGSRRMATPSSPVHLTMLSSPDMRIRSRCRIRAITRCGSRSRARTPT